MTATAKSVVVLLAVTAWFAVSSRADWMEGDPFKMHYPQLPDPLGWDVNITAPNTVADDWLCTESGPVSDVHFWLSFREDQLVPIASIHLSIHSDVPDPDGPGPLFSMPGELLWQRDFAPTEFTIAGPWSGNQGWADPTNNVWIKPDHLTYYQVNVVNIQDPFIQTMNTTNWLDIRITPLPGQQGLIGWKTSANHWNDDAVFWDPKLNQGAGGWAELREYGEGQSLDMAFVITTIPEPATLSFLCLAAVIGALAVRRRR